MQAIPQDFINLPLQQRTYICSKHFSKDAYYPKSTPTSNVRLRKDAVPTIFYTSDEKELTKNVTTEENTSGVSINF